MEGAQGDGRDPPSEQPAESLFAEWLVRREEGQAEDLEELCRRHPGLADELRSMQRRQEELDELIARFGLAGSLSERLASHFGSGVDPKVELEGEDADPGDFTAKVVGRLAGRAASTRYRLKGQVAEGGMGAILRVWDEDLRRHLAMKVILGRREAPSDATPPVDRRQLARFLEEAQVTGQLDHPGIVPVHELGLDAQGRAYFTMKLVKGRDLKAVFDLVATGEEGWNPVRALGVLQKVCEAMSYAHDKGVIHRDLKPANIMVGRYGEVYVMDWGLAKILGREEARDVRLRPDASSGPTVIRSDRREHAADTPDSPLYTMDGDVVGTPAYMPPEQAEGDLEAMGPHSDVYAVGAMLYHLLAGHMPYVRTGQRASNYAVWRWVKEGPPTSLEREAPTAPAELVAIADRAMARDPRNRYPDMPALARDLAAYLEGRVVSAYETGAWAEGKKWIRRNRALATSLAAAVLILVAGIVTSLLYAGEAQQQAERADREAQSARDLAAAETQARLTADRLREEAQDRERELRVRGLIQDLAAFDAASQSLDYALRQSEPSHVWWPRQARLLLQGQEEDLARGLPWRPGLAEAQRRLAELRARAMDPTPEDSVDGERRVWRFENSDEEWWHGQLNTLVGDLQRLEERLGFVLRSVETPEAVAAWKEAIAAIEAHPRYGGLKLAPQIGLLPIGPDPVSGLWEFAHLQTGEPPRRSTDGKLELTGETGLVFVLLPGGRFWMGAQRSDREGRNYDPQADDNESPVHEVALSPFFLSKYEMAQGPWRRIARRYSVDTRYSPLRPQHWVNWEDCIAELVRADAWITLPTEAQWEYACRAGTDTPWWTGPDADSLRGKENVKLNDDAGATMHIGRLAANPFGLHEMHGSLGEWCLDGSGAQYGTELRVDPLDPADQSHERSLRSGESWNGPMFSRSSYRGWYEPGFRSGGIGLRPARRITP